MARTASGSRQKREASHRKLGDAPTKARKPRADTLTIEKLRQCLSEPTRLTHSQGRYPMLQEALARRKDAIRSGDLLALDSALMHCFWPTRRGFSSEDAHLNPKLDPDFIVCEVPAWLLGEVHLLLSRGLGGEWPKGRGRQATAGQRRLDAERDLVRAWRVLRARERRLSWDEAIRHVSKNLKGAGGPSTVADAYERVARKLRDDPDYYRRLGPFRPLVLEVAAGLPHRGTAELDAATPEANRRARSCRNASPTGRARRRSGALGGHAHRSPVARKRGGRGPTR